MARSLSSRFVSRALVAAAAATGKFPTDPRRGLLFSPPAGIRGDKPITRLGPDESPVIENLRIYHGAYQARPGVAHAGGVITEPVITATVFVNSDNTEIPHALTTSSIYELVGDTWQKYSGPVLTASDYAQYSLTAWNDLMLYANGFDKIGKVDNKTRTYSAIAAAPAARYITTFAGRVIAGYIGSIPSRIQWSVRNNNEDWTGLGSGFEDLLSTPGGVVDAVRGIFPVSDIDAVVVRSRSIWLMRQTGDFLTPFSFSKLWDTPGTVSPWTLALTPKGLIGLFRDNIYLLTPSEAPRIIGEAVRDDVMSNVGLDFSSAAFDVYTWEYCLAISNGTETSVWRASLTEDPYKWTKDVYPFHSVRVHSSIYRDAIAMDDLEGTMDELTGPFELLGVGPHKHGLIFASGLASQFVVRDESTTVADNTPGGMVKPIVVELWSGQVGAGLPLARTHLVDVVIEYTATRDVLLEVHVSTDEGEHWELVAIDTLPQSIGTGYFRYKCGLDRSGVMLRLVTYDGAGLRVVGVYPKLSEGGEVVD